jgi:hypothetical protein
MRKRIIAVIVPLLLACLLLWWLPRRSRVKELALSISSTENITPIQAQASATGPPPASPAQRPAFTSIQKPTTEANRQDRNSRSNAAWMDSNVPLSFYGRVIDDASNAVAGASINFTWNKDDISNPLRGGENRLATQSDSAGMFTLQGERGRFLDVTIAKDGYYTPRPGTRSFRYSDSGRTPFSPDASNPVIFLLKKKGIPEPLVRLAGAIGGDRQYRLDVKGTPTEISLYTGERTLPGQGNLRIEYSMEPPFEAIPNHYHWHCRITVPGGGLLSTTEEFPFAAPVSGYTETVEANSEPRFENWSSRLNGSFYVHLSDGNYGRINLKVICSDNPYFGVETWINPSASRNLEYDRYLLGNIMVRQSCP